MLRQSSEFPSGQFEGTLEDEDHRVDWWGKKPLPNNPADCMVGDRNSDMGAGWASGLRLFQVSADVGLASRIARILDLTDDGDAFNPVR